MIKTIIKHKLLETAINNMFNKLNQNFQDLPTFYRGQQFNSMRAKIYDMGIVLEFNFNQPIIEYIKDDVMQLSYESTIKAFTMKGDTPYRLRKWICIQDIIDYD